MPSSLIWLLHGGTGGAAVMTLTDGSNPRLGRALHFGQLPAELAVLLLQLLRPPAGMQPRVALPPVDAQFAGGIDRCNQQSQFDGEQFDVEQVDPDVPGDDQAPVKNPLQ